jgi:peptidoglycan hydrolase CwlO-like protein
MEILAVVLSLSGVFLAGVNAAIFAIIKFNDLKHMQESLQRIEKKQTDMEEKLDSVAERVSKVEGRIEKK